MASELQKANALLREKKYQDALDIYNQIKADYPAESAIHSFISYSIDHCERRQNSFVPRSILVPSENNNVIAKEIAPSLAEMSEYEEAIKVSKTNLPSALGCPPIFVFDCSGLDKISLHKVLARITFYFLMFENVQAYVIYGNPLPSALDEEILEPLAPCVGELYTQTLGRRLFRKNDFTDANKMSIAAIASYSLENKDRLQKILRTPLSNTKSKIYNLSLDNRHESSVVIDIVNNYATQWLQDNPLHPKRLFNKNLSSYLQTIAHHDHCHLICNGPTMGSVDPQIFNSGHSIVCNTVLCNDDIMRHANVSLECFADPIFHFGFSKYAEEFRRSISKVLRQKPDIYIAIPRKYFFLFTALFTEFVDRLIPVEYAKRDDFNLDMSQDSVIKATANVLTFLMVPFASATKQKMFVYGIDGRPVENDSYFWGHDPKSQLSVEKMDDIKHAHPSFFKISFNEDYYYNHLSECKQLVTQLGQLGRDFNVVTPSFIDAFSNKHFRPKFSPPNSFVRSLYILIDIDTPMGVITVNSIITSLSILLNSVGNINSILCIEFYFANKHSKKAIDLINEGLEKSPFLQNKYDHKSLEISKFLSKQTSNQRKLTSHLICLGYGKKASYPGLAQRFDCTQVTYIEFQSPWFYQHLLAVAFDLALEGVISLPNADINLSFMQGKKRIVLLDKISSPKTFKDQNFTLLNSTLALMPLSTFIEIDNTQISLDDTVILVSPRELELILQSDVQKKILELYQRTKPSRFAILTSFSIACLLVTQDLRFAPLLSTLSSFAKHLSQAYPDSFPSNTCDTQDHLRLTDTHIEAISSNGLYDAVQTFLSNEMPCVDDLDPTSYFNITCRTATHPSEHSPDSQPVNDHSNTIWISLNSYAEDLSGHYVNFDVKLAKTLPGTCPFVTFAHNSFDSKIESPPDNFRILPIFRDKTATRGYQDDLTAGLSNLLPENYKNWNILLYIGSFGYLNAIIPVLKKMAEQNSDRIFTLYINLFEYADMLIYGKPHVTPFLTDRISIDDLPDNLDIKLFTDTRRSSDAFNNFFNPPPSLRVKTFPIFTPTTRNKRSRPIKAQKLTIYYSGFSHNESGLLKKGYDLALKSIFFQAQTHASLNFSIRPPSSQASASLSPEVKVLLEQIDKIDNIKLIHGVLSDEAYSDLYSQAQIVVIPYRPSSFSGRTSASLLDAWMHGCIPVVLPDTWMADQIYASPHAYGVVCSSTELLSLNKTISQLIYIYQIINKAPYGNLPPYTPHRYSAENFIEVLQKTNH